MNNKMYEGIKVIEDFEKWNDWFSKDKSIDISELPKDVEFHQNMGVVFKTTATTFVPKTKEHGIVKGGRVLQLKKYFPCGIRPLNTEQTIALELLSDDSISLVSMFGNSGSGKTLLACAHAAHSLKKGQTSKLVIAKSLTPVGRDIGYLKGPQPLTSKILTPLGWVTMGSLIVGQKIIASDGSQVEVLGVYPQGVRSVYRLTTIDGKSTECCLNHLWYTNTYENVKRKTKGTIKTTKEIMDTLEKNVIRNYAKRKVLNHSLPNNEIVNFNEKKIFIPPYTLGVLLGDGHFGDSVSFANVDKQIIKEVEGEINSIGCVLTNNKKDISYNIKNALLISKKPSKKSNLRWSNILKNELYNLKLDKTRSWNKFIPSDYKYNSAETRLRILQGLMDTDGNCLRTGQAVLTTVSEILASDVVELVRSLGGKATIHKRNRIGKKNKLNKREITTKRISITVDVSLPFPFNPFLLQRKAERYKHGYVHKSWIKSIEYVGEKEVQCIKINHPDHLYITDNFIVTHNSMEEKVLPWLGPFLDNFDKCDMPKFYVEKMITDGRIEISPITFIQGRSISNSIIIVDEIQNLELNVIKQIITRAAENCKIILLGDPNQRFEKGPSTDLAAFVDKGKESPLVGHIFFRKSVRSPIAQWACDNL